MTNPDIVNYYLTTKQAGDWLADDYYAPYPGVYGVFLFEDGETRLYYLDHYQCCRPPVEKGHFH